MKKRFVMVALAVLTAVSLSACGDKQEAASTPENTGSAVSASGEAVGLSEAIAEQPILLTSGGQSADYQMVGTVLKNLKMEYTLNNLATSADLGNNKTLVVAVGGSSKGLGAAGIDADGEISRLTELLAAAKEADMTIIVMHTGGAARRGDLSDKFIEPVFAYANYAVVVESGDADGKMAGICSQNGIPLDKVAGIGDVATVLPKAFR